MANTKKVLEEDFTKAPQAEAAEDVNNQDSKTRLWQSLSTAYGNQMEESDKAYDKSISQMNNAMQSRGMQRSSYAAQVAANMYNDKNKARNRIGEALIADYQNRIGDIEANEQENEWRQKQFDESVRQFNEGQALTREQNELNRAFQASEREATQKYNTAERIAQQIYNTGEREAQQIYNAGEREAQQAWQAGQTAQQQAWQSGENALNRAQDQAQFEVQQAFNEKQWQAQQDQWRQQFEYTKMSTDQKLAYETVINIIGQGNDPSDDLLARAGISRADVNAMKAQASSGGGGGSRSYTPGSTGGNNGDGNNKPKDKITIDALNALGGLVSGAAASTTGKTKTVYNNDKRNYKNFPIG